MERIYLDNAATTELDSRVLDAMMPYLTNKYGNPSAIHAFGRETRAAIEQARKLIAKQFNASTAEIFFTSGGTESNNTAIKGSVQCLGVKRVITSSIEHHCVLHSVEACQKHHNITVETLPVCDKGYVCLDTLKELLKDDTPTLVSIMHANNEIGTIQPIQEIGKICREHKAYFHSDTVQTAGHFNINLEDFPIDFISGSGHKIHGPKGSGFLYINADLKINPFIHGGGQERNMRAGTENLYGIIGLAKAVELAYSELEHDVQHITSLKSHFRNRILSEFPGSHVNGESDAETLYTVLNISFPPFEGSDMLIFNLDINGIAASAGSACSSGSNIGSHVLGAIGSKPDRPAVRFSFSKFTSLDEINEAIDRLKSVIKLSETV